MEKLTYEKSAALTNQNTIIIDLASFYQVSLTEKIDVIKQTINNRELISFQYYSEKGESVCNIEPYFIMFRWFAWYIYGYCLTQQDFRLFKLNRLSELHNLKTSYEERFISEKELEFDYYIWHDDIRLVALFDMNENVFTNSNYLLQWILRCLVTYATLKLSKIKGGFCYEKRGFDFK